ncbi:MAG: hypothetical protein HKN47_16215 [Pirellulaceae bacterium]|nr:hypothetical protein [Pirellulaceae bacterium]
MNFPTRFLFAAITAWICFPASANAQLTTGSETFAVTVLSSLSIVAPPAAAINHDTTDNDQVFPVQNWTAHSTELLGANVTLEAQSPFVNLLDDSFVRDAKLDLAITSSDASAGWTVNVASAATSYATGVETASVVAQSSGPGLGLLGLTVTFVETDYSSLASGAYTMTVVGTIASN